MEMYPLLSGDHSYQTGLSSSPTLEKGYQQELDRWKFYKGNEQSEDELNSMWAFMVMNEVETEPGGCRAGKFTDSKLQESWKTAWWALGSNSELKEQYYPLKIGDNSKYTWAEWTVGFVEKLQEKDQ